MNLLAPVVASRSVPDVLVLMPHKVQSCSDSSFVTKTYAKNIVVKDLLKFQLLRIPFSLRLALTPQK